MTTRVIEKGYPSCSRLVPALLVSCGSRVCRWDWKPGSRSSIRRATRPCKRSLEALPKNLSCRSPALHVRIVSDCAGTSMGSGYCARRTAEPSRGTLLLRQDVAAAVMGPMMPLSTGLPRLRCNASRCSVAQSNAKPARCWRRSTDLWPCTRYRLSFEDPPEIWASFHDSLVAWRP